MAPPSTLLLLFIISAIGATVTAQTPPSFRCSSKSTCRALIDYVTPNATTLSSIQTLFQIQNLRMLLGANNLPDSTASNFSIPASHKIIIPFTCACSNGSGISDRVPIYTVQPGDGLDHIAVDVFSRLVTYQQIQTVNNISDPNKILVGQELRIPLPCSCDEVEGVRVVHYGHVVASGSSLEAIARAYELSEKTVMELNGIANASDLQAGQVLDLPLRACNSSVPSSSLDYPLLVSNGTWVDTAGGCVTCTCNATFGWTLNCILSDNSSNISRCSAPECTITGSNMYPGLGGNVSSNWTAVGGMGSQVYANACSPTICAYAGYSPQQVFTTIASVPLCPVTTPPGSSAPTMRVEGLGQTIVFSCIYMLAFLLLVKE